MTQASSGMIDLFKSESVDSKPTKQFLPSPKEVLGDRFIEADAPDAETVSTEPDDRTWIDTARATAAGLQKGFESGARGGGQMLRSRMTRLQEDPIGEVVGTIFGLPARAAMTAAGGDRPSAAELTQGTLAETPVAIAEQFIRDFSTEVSQGFEDTDARAAAIRGDQQEGTIAETVGTIAGMIPSMMNPATGYASGAGQVASQLERVGRDAGLSQEDRAAMSSTAEPLAAAYAVPGAFVGQGLRGAVKAGGLESILSGGEQVGQDVITNVYGATDLSAGEIASRGGTSAAAGAVLGSSIPAIGELSGRVGDVREAIRTGATEVRRKQKAEAEEFARRQQVEEDAEETAIAAAGTADAQDNFDRILFGEEVDRLRQADQDRAEVERLSEQAERDRDLLDDPSLPEGTVLLAPEVRTPSRLDAESRLIRAEREADAGVRDIESGDAASLLDAQRRTARLQANRGLEPTPTRVPEQTVQLPRVMRPKAELLAEAKAKGLSTKGNKEQLSNRLQFHDATTPITPDPARPIPQGAPSEDGTSRLFASLDEAQQFAAASNQLLDVRVNNEGVLAGTVEVTVRDVNDPTIEPPDYYTHKDTDTGERSLKPYVNPEDVAYQRMGITRLGSGVDLTGPLDRLIVGADKALNTLDRVIKPVLQVVRDASPKVASRVELFLSKTMKDSHTALKEVNGFLVASNAMDKDVRLRFGELLSNGDYPQARALLAETFSGNKHQQEMLKGFDSVRPLLNRLAKESKDAGQKINVLENFFPRKVKDLRGLERFLRDTNTGQLNRAYREFEIKHGKKPTQGERIQIINNIVAGRPPMPGMGSPSQFKNRRIRKLTPEMYSRFYADPTDALESYITKTINDNAKRTLFGAKGDSSDQLSEMSIAQLIDMDENLANADSISRVADAITSMVRPAKQATWLSKLNAFTYVNLLANPITAAIQIGDVASSVVTNGLPDTARSAYNVMRGRGELNPIDLGASRIAAEFPTKMGFFKSSIEAMMGSGSTMTNKIARAADKLNADNAFMVSGMTGFDRFGKNVNLNAAVGKMRRQAKSMAGGAEVDSLNSEIATMFGSKSVDRVKKDLGSGKITPEIEALAMSRLMQVQPITRGQLPKLYMDFENAYPGSGQALYMFKSFTLNQLNAVRRSYMDDRNAAVKYMESNPQLAAQYMQRARARLGIGLSAILAMGTGVRTIQDYTKQVLASLTGDAPEPEVNDEMVVDAMIDSLLGMVGMSKYQMETFTRGSTADMMASFVGGTAGARPIEDISKDLSRIKSGEVDAWKLRTLRNIPVIGNIFDRTLGEGVDRMDKSFYRERREKESSLNSTIRGNLFDAVTGSDVKGKAEEWLVAHREIWDDTYTRAVDMKLAGEDDKKIRSFIRDKGWNEGDVRDMYRGVYKPPSINYRSRLRGLQERYADDPKALEQAILRLKLYQQVINSRKPELVNDN